MSHLYFPALSCSPKHSSLTPSSLSLPLPLPCNSISPVLEGHSLRFLHCMKMIFSPKLSFLVFLLCVLISLKNRNAETNRGFQAANWFSSSSSSVSESPVSSPPMSRTIEMDLEPPGSLRYDYYRETCSGAEHIVKSVVQELYLLRPDIASALLRLLFHDCFVKGCDASVLLDPADGIESEKDSPPNKSLKGFEVIDNIKSELEKTCTGVVSCSDILVLAARESVILAGGPFYPLQTGRRDSTISFTEEATYELPRPEDDLSKIIEKFGSRGFNEEEIVCLLGAHSTGKVHCNRLYNFGGTDQPDPSIDSESLNILRSKCGNDHTSVHQSASPSLSPARSLSVAPSSSINDLSSALVEGPSIEMDYEGPGSGFGTIYYQSLLQSRGILYADQQLTAGEETKTWVRAYASDLSLFYKNFSLEMIKLSNHQVLTAPLGQVRLHCRNVA